METVNLSAGEEQLIASIIEHVYPDPQAGSTLPVEHCEKRAARGLAKKGLVVLSVDERGVDQMTFTVAGQGVYEERLKSRDCALRDPRQSPKIGDELEIESGRRILVSAVTSLFPRKGFQVAYFVMPSKEGNACGLSTWRKKFKRATVLKVAT